MMKSLFLFQLVLTLVVPVGYAQAREAALRVFLQYPNVPVDTNHLEREIRPFALGRKNWMFCWTKLGAENTDS